MKGKVAAVLLGLLLFTAGAGCRRGEVPAETPPAPETPPAAEAPAGEERRPEPGLDGYPRLMVETRRTAREMEVLLPLRQGLEMFRALEGRYPETLEEMVARGYYGELPEPPPGTRFEYRPGSGEVDLVPKAE